MLEDERGLNGVSPGILRRGVLLRGLVVRVIAAGNGARLLANGNVHGRVKRSQLNTVPERTPDEPRLVIVIDDEVRVDGVPVVTLHLTVGTAFPFVRGHDAALVLPQISSERATAEQADGRTVLAEGGAAVGQPPAPVPFDDIGCPHVTAEAWHRVRRPAGYDGHHGLRQHCPRLAVFRGHLLDAHACGKDVIRITVLSHHRVVHHGRLGGECLALEAAARPLCVGCLENGCKSHCEKNLVHHCLIIFIVFLLVPLFCWIMFRPCCGRLRRLPSME